MNDVHISLLPIHGRRSDPAHGLLAASSLLLILLTGEVRAAEATRGAERLLQLINDYRSESAQCDGGTGAVVAPLAPEPALSSVILEGRNLRDALHASDIKLKRAEVVTVSGPDDAEGALQFLRKRNCALLRNPSFTVAGVSRDGNKWQVVLGQPLLAPDLGDWRSAGKEILERVNAARAEARQCGERNFEPAPALKWDARLADAARFHSRDMADNDYFSHQGRDGGTAGDRTRKQGYVWRQVGENIAAGQGSPQRAVASWLASPGHCSNLMNPAYREMGAAYAMNPNSEVTIFWAQVFGTPR